MRIPYLHVGRAPRDRTPVDRALVTSLRRDVETLAIDIGPRGTFAPARYRLAEEFLTSALRQAGHQVQRRAYEAMGVECANMVVEIRGTRTPDRILIVGAHYDSIEGCPAANDNGSGVAGVLAIARAFSGRRFASTLRLALFANEEPPFFNLGEMGSQVYARECRRAGDDIRGMFCLETLGYFSNRPGSQRWPSGALNLVMPTVGDFISFVGPASAKGFIKRAAEIFESQGAVRLLAAAAPEMIDQINWSDHRGFNEAGYEAFMITDTAPFRYDHYHRPTDTPEKLDYESMARVVVGVIGMTEKLAEVP